MGKTKLFEASFDLHMDYKEAKETVERYGWYGWLKHLNTLYPEKKLYFTSKGWIYNRKLTCQVLGQNGSISIGWKAR